ncbi:VOC family protein [Streptomyces cyanogenus]|uniref:Glyoxalase-like domain protein n=1 Tax=Streptomyces cyanogenus TaxID=80860 RepID=A0ABX7TYN6_STRCY|nr:VOC family protein [Streptomyces cyanogenus]QTE01587.1 Glyoxalase-like domain protein [Streptomyces cyanogenus]
MFGSLSAVLIKCDNFEEMKAFYRDRLNMATVKEGDGWIVLDTGSGGELVLGGDTGGDTMAIAFTGAELGPAREGLRDSGPTEIEKHSDMHRFFVKDPDGNTVLIID